MSLFISNALPRPAIARHPRLRSVVRTAVRARVPDAPDRMLFESGSVELAPLQAVTPKVAPPPTAVDEHEPERWDGLA